MCTCTPKKWQFFLAFWGSVLWFSSAPYGIECGISGNMISATVFGGFFLGGCISMGTCFTWLLVTGQYHTMIRETNIRKWTWWFHGISLLLLTAWTGWAVYVVEANTAIHNWYFFFAMAAGSNFFTSALWPVIKHYDAQQAMKHQQDTGEVPVVST